MTFISKDAIKYYDILETTNSLYSHSQGEAGDNAISLDKLVMLSCDMIIVPDT